MVGNRGRRSPGGGAANRLPTSPGLRPRIRLAVAGEPENSAVVIFVPPVLDRYFYAAGDGRGPPPVADVDCAGVLTRTNRNSFAIRIKPRASTISLASQGLEHPHRRRHHHKSAFLICQLVKTSPGKPVRRPMRTRRRACGRAGRPALLRHRGGRGRDQQPPVLDRRPLHGQAVHEVDQPLGIGAVGVVCTLCQIVGRNRLVV